MEIRFKNEVYDLSIKELRSMLYDDVEKTANQMIDLEDEDFEELEEIHFLINEQNIKALTIRGILKNMLKKFSRFFVSFNHYI